MSDQQVLRTTYPDRAAILATQGCRHITSEPNPKGYLEFVFDDSNNLATIASGSFVRDESLPIATFLNHYRRFNELIRLWRDARKKEAI